MLRPWTYADWAQAADDFFISQEYWQDYNEAGVMTWSLLADGNHWSELCGKWRVVSQAIGCGGSNLGIVAGAEELLVVGLESGEVGTGFLILMSPQAKQLS